MTLLLAHPTDEDLGRFVEGTLPDTERREVVAHIADCDECRILVVDSAEFIEPAKTESSKWWMGIAASLILVAAIGTLTYNHFHEPLAPVIEASAQVPLIETRLSGFAYLPRHAMRGGPEDGTDLQVMPLEEAAANVLTQSGDDPKISHARGVAHLVTAVTAKPQDNIDIASEQREAVAALVSAATREPKNAGYQNDVAAALLSTGDPKQRNLALVYVDKALVIEPRNPEALFNRAVALEQLNRLPEAIAAYDRYLSVDPAPPWADEAKTNRERVQEMLRPLS